MSTDSESETLFGRIGAALARGALRDAQSLALEAARQFPMSARAYCALASVEERLGNATGAVLAFRRAIALSPAQPELWSRLGSVLAGRARWREAIDAHEQAWRLSPANPQHLIHIATSQLSAQRFEDARRTSRLLLERHGSEAATHVVSAHVQLAFGNQSAALRAYKQALQLNPHCAPALAGTVDLQTPLPGSEPARLMEQLLLRADLPVADRASLQFSLAQIFDKAQCVDRAFELYRQANLTLRAEMHSRGLAYDRVKTAHEFSTATSYCDAGSFSALPPLPTGFRPIFIIGMPRSGTTLIEQILASHPAVTAGGELTAGTRVFAEFLVRRTKEGSIKPVYADDRPWLTQLRNRYVENILADDIEADIITDKFPGNFLIAGFLRLLFPDSAVVHCRRHPIATCWSLYTTKLAAHSPYYADLGDLAHFYGLYQHLMSRWRLLLDPPMIEVDYEQLIQDPRTVIARLLECCRLPWSEQCLEFFNNPRPVVTASMLQVRRPLYFTSIGRWLPYRPYLSELERLL